MGALAIGGGFAFAGAIQTEMRERKMASQLAAQVGRPEEKGRILSEARGVKGFTGEEAIGALTAWADITGDLDSGRAVLTELSQVALATSTNIDELAGAAANAFIPLSDQIADPIKRMEVMKEVMRSIAGMGAVGAVEVKDLASQMAGLAAQANKFEGGPKLAMQTAVAMSQAARQRGGAASAAEAVTSVERFSSDIVTKQKALRGMGVEVFADEGRTQLRSQQEIIQDILGATGGDLGKIRGIFGERSIRAIQGFSPLYTAAEKREKGSGKAAVAAEFARLLGATLDDDALQERVASRLEDPDIVWKESVKEFQHAIGSELLPAVMRLVPEITQMIPELTAMASVIADIAGWTIQNPLAGLSVIIGASFARELASAGIGKMIAGELSGIGGIIGGSLVGATIGIAVATMMVESAIINAKKASKERGKTLAKDVEAAWQEKQETGTLTPETRARLQKWQAEGAKRTAQAESVKDEGFWAGAGRLGMSVLGGLGFDVDESSTLEGGAEIIQAAESTESRQTQLAAAKALLDTTPALEAAAASLSAAGEKLAKAQPNRGDAPGAADPAP
jgi:hypothetical protein